MQEESIAEHFHYYSLHNQTLTVGNRTQMDLCLKVTEERFDLHVNIKTLQHHFW